MFYARVLLPNIDSASRSGENLAVETDFDLGIEKVMMLCIREGHPSRFGINAVATLIVGVLWAVRGRISAVLCS